MYDSSMKKYIILLALVFCVFSVAFAQAGRNTRYVAVQSTTLKSSAGAFASDVANLSLGDTVTLVSESGKWSQVQSGSVTGWIQTNQLSTRRVVSASAAGASASEVALAGKGFSAQTENEYQRAGLDFTLVDSMERITVPSADLQRFITDGRLNRGD